LPFSPVEKTHTVLGKQVHTACDPEADFGYFGCLQAGTLFYCKILFVLPDQFFCPATGKLFLNPVIHFQVFSLSSFTYTWVSNIEPVF